MRLPHENQHFSETVTWHCSSVSLPPNNQVRMLSVLYDLLLNDVEIKWVPISSNVHVPFPTTFPVCTVLLPIIIAAFAYIHRLAYRPSDRVRDLSSIGFWQLKESDKRRLTMKQLANEALKQRKTGDVPPVYPNGWFSIVETKDLKKGEVKPVYAVGINLVVFRGEDGVARVLDAYCPHLGAHLGVGSYVRGNCIECPFHGWQFRGSDGKCTTIPNAEKVPEFAKIKTWTACEMNGRIYFWFHAEGEKPSWYPIEVQEITKGQWKYWGRSENFINAHIQEIPENGADVNHLPQVHGPSIAVGSNIGKIRGTFWDFTEHIWDGDWSVNPGPDSHIGILKITQGMTLFKKFTLNKVEGFVQQIGPAIVHFNLETLFGKVVIIHTVTPVEPLKQRMIHTLYAESKMPALFAKFVLYATTIMVERDIVIWNQKTFLPKPLLIKEDKYIMKFRRWYSQFYSENSPRLHFQKDTLEW